MEPIDDILIPQSRPSSAAGRLRTRHVLRTFAALVIISTGAYIVGCWYIDAQSVHGQRMTDLIGAAPGLLFGIALWWYSGRNIDEFNQPLFRNKSDPQSARRIDGRSGFWIGASLLSGFFGLCSVTLGAVLALRGKQIVNTFPELQDHDLARLKSSTLNSVMIDNVRISPINLLAIGGGLLVLTVVAVILAKKQRAAKN